jgi:outer membrane scaffolding protein for murein synthesis (MipA/OmpV family)/membrane protease YdiL (CAAX protease family)
MLTGIRIIAVTTILLGLITPFFIALYLTFSSRHLELEDDFIDKITNIRRISIKTLPAIILIPIFTVILSILVSLLFGLPVEQFKLSNGFSFHISTIPTLLILLITASLEELGWRGYAIESLMQRYSYFASTFIFSILWSLWHFPLVFIQNTYQHAIFNLNALYAVNFFLSIIPLTFIISWLCHENKHSVIAAILLHFNINICQELFMIENDTKCIQTAILMFIAIGVVIFNKQKFFNPVSIATIGILFFIGAEKAQAQEFLWDVTPEIRRMAMFVQNSTSKKEQLFSVHYDIQNETYKNDHNIQEKKVTSQKSPWDITFGAGAISTPVYEGSNEHKFLGLPYFDIQYKDKLTVNAMNGARYYPSKHNSLNYGIGLTYRMAREENDSIQLKGLGDVKSTSEGLLFAEYNLGKTKFSCELSKDLMDKHNGLNLGMKAEYLAILSQNILMSPSLKFTFADNNFMESFFGISNNQSIKSGLPQFTADSCLKDVSLAVPMIYKLNSRP